MGQRRGGQKKVPGFGCVHWEDGCHLLNGWRHTFEAEDQWTGFEPVKFETLRPPPAVAKEASGSVSLESFSASPFSASPIAFSQTFPWTL